MEVTKLLVMCRIKLTLVNERMTNNFLNFHSLFEILFKYEFCPSLRLMLLMKLLM